VIVLFRKIKEGLIKMFSKKIHGANKKWYEHELNRTELIQFIEAVRRGESRNAFIGKISNKTAKKIKTLVGADITKIILESSAVIHAEKNVKHNLMKDDIPRCVEVINNPKSIKKSPRQNRGNPVLLFEGDINGSIIFVESVHIKHGELFLITAYRKNEVGQGSTG